MPQIHLRMTPSQVSAVALDSIPSNGAMPTMDDLAKLGVFFDEAALKSVMDAAPAAITTPTVANALQFLQYFFPKAIKVVTQARVADELLGRTIAGSWADQEIVQRIMENIGQPRPYTDAANVPEASFNQNFEARTVYRMELGASANRLEIERASRMLVDAMEAKRSAAATALAIGMNDVAFNGYNDGNSHTYGILNDPGLGAYVTVAQNAGGTSTTWANKTYLEIIADIRTAVAALRTQSGSNFDPERDAFTLGVASACRDALDTTSEYGKSVMGYIRETYPRCRVVSVPQFNGANATANVFYVIAEELAGEPVVDQYVQAELFLVGACPTAKGGMLEDYSNATAGTFVTVPAGIVRYTGI